MTETEQTATGRRGRPRPKDTLDRDADVLELIRTSGPITTAAIAEQLRMEKQSIAYLSVYRLKRDNAIESARDAAGKNAWQVKDTSSEG